MELVFNGHACVTLRSREATVVLDPYRPGAFEGRIAHAAVREHADVVVVSHYHVDHGFVTPALGGGAALPPVVDRSGDAAGRRFRMRFVPHDAEGGIRMGMTGMVAFELDGLRVAHLGDVGCPLAPADVEALAPVDVLLWPVGGRYTVGPADAPGILEALRPRLAVPVHFEHPRCRLGMAPVEALGPHLQRAPERPGASGWSSAEGLPDEPTVRILEPAR